MPGEPVVLGPFLGGLNKASDPSIINDAEVSECINFELDLDGSLVSRPPFTVHSGAGSFTERIVFLGVAVFSAGTYIIGSNTNGVYRWVPGGAWTLITNTFQARAAVQYADKVWLIAKPGSANPGGSWDPIGGFVADADIPKGEAAVVYKERLFVAPGYAAVGNSNRLWFSEPGAFSSWPSTNFFDINPGDGEKLIDLVVYNNNLMLFKKDSVYALSYATKPTDAQLVNVTRTVGASRYRCVTQFENSIFTFHEGNIYELVNFDFTRINTKLPFSYDAGNAGTRSEEVFLSLFGERLIVRYYNKIYVYGLRTKTWSEWKSADLNGHNFGPLVAYPSAIASRVDTSYYGGSSILSNLDVVEIKNGYDSTRAEVTDIVCKVRTKLYDIGVAHRFKRLFWWGVDFLSNTELTGRAIPTVANFAITWGQASAYTWGQARSSTWGSPMSTPPDIVTTYSNTTGGLNRKFAKFLKALRFRQIAFEVELKTSGSTDEGPCRVMSITAIVLAKQKVTQWVN